MKNVNLKGVPKAVWVRVIALFLVWANLVSFNFLGFELIPFEEPQIFEGVSYVLTAVVTLWTSWKNNGFTQIAQEKDEEIREAKKKIK